MAERRSLTEGLKIAPPVDPALEEGFVYGKKKKAARASDDASDLNMDGRGGSINRVPFTTRVRADFAKAVKRASLERQLDGKHPNTLQEILEEALEPWLRTNGYLD